MNQVMAGLLLAALCSATPVGAAEPAKAKTALQPRDSNWPRHRYAAVGGGLLILGGIGLGYWSAGEARRARTISTAATAKATLQTAQSSAATANMLYAVGGLTFLYAAVLELFPPKVQERASLSFAF